jgi:hypothetical protein
MCDVAALRAATSLRRVKLLYLPDDVWFALTATPLPWTHLHVFRSVMLSRAAFPCLTHLTLSEETIAAARDVLGHLHTLVFTGCIAPDVLAQCTQLRKLTLRHSNRAEHVCSQMDTGFVPLAHLHTLVVQGMEDASPLLARAATLTELRFEHARIPSNLAAILPQLGALRALTLPRLSITRAIRAAARCVIHAC